VWNEIVIGIEREGTMKKIALLFVAMAAVLTGCSGSSKMKAVKNVAFDRYKGYIASSGNRLHFAIITDGEISGGLTNTILVGANYSGVIGNEGSGQSIKFSSRGNSITIGNQQYRLDKGRLFLVATGDDPFYVGQFEVTETNKVSDLVKNDERMIKFFGKGE